MSNDPFDLQRFLDAQEPVIDRALAELSEGRKQSHWMWFVFPQLKGLGRSSTAQFYGIEDIDEARAYLAHPVLGPRLEAAALAALEAPAATLNALFGSPDDLKFVSSMTLFARATGGDGGVYRRALDRWANGSEDPKTRTLLRQA